MRRQERGQSLVEMAFVAPVLILILFGIMDLSWYLYGYSTVYQAARNGAEKAASLPPGKTPLGLSNDPSDPPDPPDANDRCVASVLAAVQQGAVMFPNLGTSQYVRINYPQRNDDGSPRRARGSTIEVTITYDFNSLTPLWNLVGFGNEGLMHVETTARRTIENLGQSPQGENGVICQAD